MKRKIPGLGVGKAERVPLVFIVTFMLAFGVGFYTHFKTGAALESLKNDEMRLMILTSEVENGIGAMKNALLRSSLQKGDDALLSREIDHQAEMIDAKLATLLAFSQRIDHPTAKATLEELIRVFGHFVTIGRGMPGYYRISYEEGNDSLGALEGFGETMTKLLRKLRINVRDGFAGAVKELELEIRRNFMIMLALGLFGIFLIYRYTRNFFIDDITGAYNQDYLMEKLVGKGYKGLVLLNIDNFDRFNTLYGYRRGDLVLQAVVRVLESHKPEHTTVCRIGGDEFCCLLEEQDAFHGRELAEEIVQGFFASPLTVDQVTVRVRFSAGFTAGNGVQLLEQARSALREARAVGKKRIRAYSPSTGEDRRWQANMEILEKIEEAVVHDMIIPVYQPIASNKDGSIVKFEVLARLRDPENNVIHPPADFIESARLAGILPEIKSGDTILILPQALHSTSPLSAASR